MAIKKDTTTRKAPATTATPQADTSSGPARDAARPPGAPVAPAKPPVAPAQGRRTEAEQPAARPQNDALQNQGSSPATTSRRPPEEIARRAYDLWQQRGAPHGSDQEDWLRAERELEGKSRH